MMKRKIDGENQIIVITGATSGIGYATARNLAHKGAAVIGAGRSQTRCKEAEESILKDFPDARVYYVTADLSSLKQVKELAVQIREVVRKMGRDYIDVLVNNAGAFSKWYVSTPDGFELQFAVNHLAPFLLTRELLPMLKASGVGKVIGVSSGSHYGTRMHWDDVLMRRHYFGLAAYKQSKLANVLFATEFNRRISPVTGVRAFAVDPGLVNTDIGSKSSGGLEKWIWTKRKDKGMSAQVPATCISFISGNEELQNSPHVYWRDCNPKPPSAYSQKPEVALRLWELSEKMCGVKYEL